MSVPAFVMKIFEPFTTHSPSRSSARVRVAPASEPAPGSVRPNAASSRPEARSGSHSRFCSSRAEEEDRHRPERRVRGDRDRDGRVDRASAPRSRSRRRACRRPRRRTPRGSGMPMSPSSASPATMSYGKRCSRSSSSATGATRSSANSRTVRADQLVLVGAGRSPRPLSVPRRRGRARRRAGRRSRSRPAAGSSRRGRARGRPVPAMSRCAQGPSPANVSRKAPRRSGAACAVAGEFFRSANGESL